VAKQGRHVVPNRVDHGGGLVSIERRPGALCFASRCVGSSEYH
jgi:hypothetical protein